MNTIAKEALFRRCADQCDTVEMMSRDMVGYQTEFEEFQRLHREIEDEDFEDEYQEWRKANGYIKWEEIREIPKLLTKEEGGQSMIIRNSMAAVRIEVIVNG